MEDEASLSIVILWSASCYGVDLIFELLHEQSAIVASSARGPVSCLEDFGTITSQIPALATFIQYLEQLECRKRAPLRKLITNYYSGSCVGLFKGPMLVGVNWRQQLQ